MHFFNPRPLAEKLRDGTLSERDKLSYLLASTVVRLIAEFPRHLFNLHQPFAYSLLLFVINVVVSLVGLSICFKTNERGDNKAFIERWLCLTLPLFVWTSLLPASLMLFYYALYPLVGRAYAGFFNLSSILITVVAWVLFLLYFVLLNHFIRIAAGGPVSNDNRTTAPIATP